MPVPAEIIGPAMMGITQGVSTFNQFLPPLHEVRKHTPQGDPEFAADVRVGEVAASALILGIGAVASSLTGSTAPIVVAALTAIGLIILYESTLRTVRPFERTA